MAFPSAIGCIVIGQSPIESGPHCQLVVDDHVCRIIPSYLYWQYKDDDNLQAFVDSYNSYAQEFAEWFCSLNLPIYTSDPVSGALLDWVGEGLYGYSRPVLGEGRQEELGPYNTWAFNELDFNGLRNISNATALRVNDDLYRRSLSWHFQKGDGRIFNVRYLKRRIMRWLIGENGIDPGIDQTYRISVSFGYCCQVNITLVIFKSVVLSGAFYNTFAFNETVNSAFNDLEIIVTQLGPQFDLGDKLKEAIDEGFLELPFQFNYVVTVQH